MTYFCNLKHWPIFEWEIEMWHIIKVTGVFTTQDNDISAQHREEWREKGFKWAKFFTCMTKGHYITKNL